MHQRLAQEPNIMNFTPFFFLFLDSLFLVLKLDFSYLSCFITINYLSFDCIDDFDCYSSHE